MHGTKGIQPRSGLLSYYLASQAGTKAVVCESSLTEARLHYRSHGTGLDTCVLPVVLCVCTCASHAVCERGSALHQTIPVVALLANQATTGYV